MVSGRQYIDLYRNDAMDCQELYSDSSCKSALTLENVAVH